jgi:predicted dehydrogenase
MLKVAVIGTGLIATLKHLPAWKRAKDFARVVALCDIDIARAAEMAPKFGIPSTYANTREMYDKETPDIVDVCTPPAPANRSTCRSFCSLPLHQA